MIVAGADIGGTHITVCLMNIVTGKLDNSSMIRKAVDPSGTREEVIATWAEAIQLSHQQAGVAIHRVGIAMPGPFDYEKGISYIRGLHKYENLYQCNVKELLATALDIDAQNIRFINDASGFLLGEMQNGAGKGYSNVVGITLGTGLGSAGFRHNQLEEGDFYCTSFAGATCEEFISARWLLRNFASLSGREVKGVKNIAELFTTDENARRLFEQYGQNLGRALVQRYREQAPEVIIIGGNISKAWSCFVPAASEAIAQAGAHFQLRPAVLGEDAALTGAAFLFKPANA